MSGLLRLSLERVEPGKPPRPTPTNDDRVRAFRAFAPIAHANPLFTGRLPRSAHERYAAEACADSAASDDHWRPIE